MNIILISTLFKTAIIFLFIIFCIVAVFYTEVLVSSIFSRKYYTPYGGNPIRRLLKLLTKKEIFLRRIDSSFFFNLIPILSVIFALIPISIIPICESYYFKGMKQTGEIFSTEYGIFFFFAFSSFNIFALIWRGYCVKNELITISCVRAVYREMTCRAPILITVFSMVVFYKSYHLEQIVLFQKQNHWGMIQQPLAAFVFFISLMAELGKAPFDTAENYYELNRGHGAECFGVKGFFLEIATQIRSIVLMLIFICFFMGGYEIFPLVNSFINLNSNYVFIAQGGSLLFKVMLVVVTSTLLQLLIPHYRPKDLLSFGQRILLPLAFINLLIVVAGQYFIST